MSVQFRYVFVVSCQVLYIYSCSKALICLQNQSDALIRKIHFEYIYGTVAQHEYSPITNTKQEVYLDMKGKLSARKFSSKQPSLLCLLVGRISQTQNQAEQKTLAKPTETIHFVHKLQFESKAHGQSQPVMDNHGQSWTNMKEHGQFN